jgi:SulP family sulfate permease
MSLTAHAEIFWKFLQRDMVPDRIFPSLITSLVVAMMTVVVSVSFVALIFVDPITGFMAEGTSLMLVTAAILGIFMAAFSSFPGMIAIPQDRVAPIVALMASLIIQQMHGQNPEVIGVTVLAAIASSAVVVGLVLVFLGVYRLGNLVRFIPYPVIGGFLAGTGWLLLTGSFRVISSEPLSLRLDHLYASGALAAWAPCAIFGTISYLAVRYTKHFLTLPVLVFSAMVLFSLWLGWHHISWMQARAHAWILGAPPDAGLHQMRTLPALIHANWAVIFNQYSSLGALLVTSVISILLNTTALELAADEDIDLNTELRAAGLGNVFGGVAGGMIGFQSLSLSALPISMGVRSRLVGLVSAIVCLLILCFGTQLLGYIPRFILGGILFYNGLSFLAEWVFDAYFRLQHEDYFIVVLMLGVVAFAGYLQGVGAGVIIATVLFVVKYSRVNVIGYVLSGDGHRSTVDRSPPEVRLLNTSGAQIYILRLKGFIFFGSANNLLHTIRERQADPRLAKLRYVILDFHHVSGMDTSGVVSMSKLSRLAKKEGALILGASVPVDIQNSFRAAGLFEDKPGQIYLFPDRDHAMEWCENDILGREFSALSDGIRSLPEILRDAHPWKTDTTALLNYVERLEVDQNYPLIRQGDEANELYFIESGKVKVMIGLDNGQSLRVRTMGPGTVVGEIGLYLGQKRVASVLTEEPCIIYRFTADALHQMEQEEPSLASAFHEFMVRVLAERVTQQNRALASLVE